MSLDQTQPYDRLEAALLEYVLTREQGKAPDRDEFLARYADLADQLRPFLDAVPQSEQFAEHGLPLQHRSRMQENRQAANRSRRALRNPCCFAGSSDLSDGENRLELGSSRAQPCVYFPVCPALVSTAVEHEKLNGVAALSEPIRALEFGLLVDRQANYL